MELANRAVGAASTEVGDELASSTNTTGGGCVGRRVLAGRAEDAVALTRKRRELARRTRLARLDALASVTEVARRAAEAGGLGIQAERTRHAAVTMVVSLLGLELAAGAVLARSLSSPVLVLASVAIEAGRASAVQELADRACVASSAAVDAVETVRAVFASVAVTLVELAAWAKRAEIRASGSEPAVRAGSAC